MDAEAQEETAQSPIPVDGTEQREEAAEEQTTDPPADDPPADDPPADDPTPAEEEEQTQEEVDETAAAEEPTEAPTEAPTEEPAPPEPQEAQEPVVLEASAPRDVTRPRPIGPLYSEGIAMYPEYVMEPVYHTCGGRAYKSTYSNAYKTCTATTIESTSGMVPKPPAEPKPATPPKVESPEPSPEPIMRPMPTFFAEIPEDHVTFCIDTSGSMYYVLDTVKENLVDVLMQRANQKSRETTFNVIDFSTEVTQWSNKMVRCSPQTVGVARRWIEKMAPKTGTNTLDALLTAFRDPVCEAVCLVTDGLSDQHPEAILDGIHVSARNRPVHAYYIQGDRVDKAAVDFLHTLAMETYGSFHVVHVTQLGAVERVAPVYRTSAAAERIVRTTSGNAYPSNHRVVRTAHTVHTPPTVATTIAPPSFVQATDPFWPYLNHPYYLYPWPYRHFFQYYSPTVGWSRYRPARAFLKETELLMEEANTLPASVPGPGAMLLGQKVLARKHEDGFFYMGTVKSQVLDNKFLVEFGPLQHGKYKDTLYQETFVYDIVSYTDALRHAVVTGDRVLAPWAPDGEKYGPGEVIEGQEARNTDGYRDQQLVIHFFNGETVKVPAQTAIWIPQMLHERVTFELQLPSKVRQEFREQSMYPEESLPGYPTTPIRANPTEYEAYEPAWIPGDRPVQVRAAQPQFYRYPFAVPRYGYGYGFDPRYATEYRAGLMYGYGIHGQRSEQQEVETDPDAAIPGTDLTRTQLSEKVTTQIQQNKDVFKSTEDDDKLLKRREKMEENTLKKSVSFGKDRVTADLEAEFESGHLDFGDSGRGSAEDLWLLDVEDEKETREIGVGTSSDRRLGQKRRPKSAPGKRPPWRYWPNDPAPELHDPMHYGPYRVGPYEPWLEPVPLERRCIQRGEFSADWAGSQSQFVDPMARTAHNGPSVADSMNQWPRPPSAKPVKQGPGEEVGVALGKHLAQQDQLFQERTEFRRAHALERELRVRTERDDEFLQGKMMRDQHHERIMAQLEHERQRQLQQIEKVEQQREAKKRVHVEVKARIENYQQREQEREGQRYERMRAARDQREERAAQQMQEQQEIAAKKQAAQQQRAEAREAAYVARIAEQEAGMAAAEVRARHAKLQRREHYRALEAEGQRRRTLQVEVNGQRAGILRSQVFPTGDGLPQQCACGGK